jgi:DNA-binding transcriptional ArsR family regulator
MDDAELEQEAPAPGVPADRTLDLESLKALSHPLRLQLFDELSTFGPATASGLAEKLGESSGATSYHLRQLEKHGFVREVEGRGSARERWWERVPGSITVDHRDTVNDPVGRAVTELVSLHFQQHSESLLNDFIRRGYDEMPHEWADVSNVTTMNVRLTQPQLKELMELFQSTIQPWVDRHRGKEEPGSRPVQIHLNSFPVIGGIETPQTYQGEES